MWQPLVLYLTLLAAASTSPTSAGVNALLAGADKAHTGGLVLARDGQTVVERGQDAPDKLFKLNSLTKPFTWMAIGLLIGEGKIPSVDTPVSTYYRAWGTGPEARATIRHLLAHTSGLPSAADAPGDGSTYFSAADSVASAAAQPLTAPPGQRKAYSNAGYQILAGVVGKAAGQPMAAYLADRLFRPLGITRWTWSHDGVGTTNGYAGLSLAAPDLAKVGWLVGNGGSWQGRQLLPAGWTATARQGLCWHQRPGRWVMQTSESLDRLARAGFPAWQKLAPLTGLRLDRTMGGWYREAKQRLTPAEYEQLKALHVAGADPIGDNGFEHTGAGGQYLIIHPETGLVLVRLVDAFNPRTGESPWAFDEIEELFDDVLEAAEPKP